SMLPLEIPRARVCSRLKLGLTCEDLLRQAEASLLLHSHPELLTDVCVRAPRSSCGAQDVRASRFLPPLPRTDPQGRLERLLRPAVLLRADSSTDPFEKPSSIRLQKGLHLTVHVCRAAAPISQGDGAVPSHGNH